MWALSNHEIVKMSKELHIPNVKACWNRAQLDRALQEGYRNIVWNDSPKGTHWTAVSISIGYYPKAKINVFNSMGLPLDGDCKRAIEANFALRKMDIFSEPLHYECNDVAYQASDTESCGWWALFALWAFSCNNGVFPTLSTTNYVGNEQFLKGFFSSFGIATSR
jgi:hypothetical protein